MKLIRESEHEMVFANTRWVGAVPLVMGVIFIAVMTLTGGGAGAGAVGLIVGGVFSLAGLAIMLWREELRLDLAAGRFRYSRGFAFTLKPVDGAFSDVTGVSYKTMLVKNKNSTSVFWTVSIHFKNMGTPPEVFRSADEVAAHAMAERVCKALRADLMDETAEQHTRTAWTDLDRPATERMASIPDPGPLPRNAGFRIEGREIVLPRNNVAAVIGILVLGLIYVQFGMAFMAGAGAGAHPTARAIFIALLTLFTFGFAYAVARLLAKDRIRREGSRLVNASALGTFNLKSRSIPCLQIEEITVRPRPKNRTSYELLIRSDKEALVIGKGFPKDSLEWLRARILSIIA